MGSQVVVICTACRHKYHPTLTHQIPLFHVLSLFRSKDAYFVPKRVLIDWVNRLLDTNISKVEDCASGAIHLHVSLLPLHYSR